MSTYVRSFAISFRVICVLTRLKKHFDIKKIRIVGIRYERNY